MTTSDRILQKWLRQIVLKEAANDGIAPLGNRPRIGDDNGATWWDDKDDKKDDDPNDQDPKDDDEPDDRDPNDPNKHDPSSTPKNGDTANGIGPLYPCDGGKCVNVRLDGLAKPPQGWTDACTPPDEPDEDRVPIAWTAHAYWYNNAGKRVSETQVFTSLGAAQGWARGMIPKGESTDGVPILTFKKQSELSYASEGSGYYKYENGRKPDEPAYYSAWVTGIVCETWIQHSDCNEVRKKLKEEQGDNANNGKFPMNECSEVIFKDGKFQPACAKNIDPHVPAIFEHQPTAFTLCDKNGNQVTISQDKMGWKIDHPDYTAYVNSDFRFQNVQPKMN